MRNNVTMSELPGPLEIIWDALLSREPGTVRAMFASLDQGSQKVVLNHLQRMAGEEGWHPEQRLSAQLALAALHDMSQ